MKLIEYHKHFLATHVNLNQTRIDTLDSRVSAVTSFLEGHGDIGPKMLDVIPQGSYAQKTIIKPRTGRDFDSDVLLEFEEQADWEAKDYIAKLYSAFRSASTYRYMVDRKTRCVTVQYANDFHIDVVPYLDRGHGKYITNRHDNVFEVTNPEGFNAWLDQQNRTAKGRLVEVIRLMKYIRDFKGTFTVKSVILTTLLGGVVDSIRLWADEKYYSDLPTALHHCVQDLDAYLQSNPTLPVIPDPSNPTENFNQRWDQESYVTFRRKIHDYAALIKDAYEEENRDASVEKWQKVFGSGFVKPPQQTLALSEAKALGADTEEFLERDYDIPTRHSRYVLRVDGRVTKKQGFRDYRLATRGNRVPKGRTIVFQVTKCDVPTPYDVYWKVKNTGAEAEARNQLRGQILRDQGGHERREPTAYRGSHYVECFIVKDGACVAQDRQRVNVE